MCNGLTATGRRLLLAAYRVTGNREEAYALASRYVARAEGHRKRMPGIASKGSTGQRLTPEEYQAKDALVLGLYLEHRSWEEVARVTDMTRSAVSHYARRRGLLDKIPGYEDVVKKYGPGKSIRSEAG